MKRPFAPLVESDYMIRSLVMWPLLLAGFSLAATAAVVWDSFVMVALMGILFVLLPFWLVLLVGTLIINRLEAKISRVRAPGWIIPMVYGLLWAATSGIIAFGFEVTEPLHLALLAGWGAVFVGVKTVLDLRWLARRP